MKLDYVPIPKTQVTIAAYAFLAGLLTLPWALQYVLPEWLQHKYLRALISLMILLPALFYWASRPRKS
jgi:high-affinity Fe2+/Pb2+ permease